MIISRTPYRCSILGGLLDFPGWFLKHGGVCIGTTIDKYSFLTVRHLPPFHEYKSRLVYSKIETVFSNSQIEHKAIKEAIKYLGMDEKGLEIFHAADIPGRSGIGSSSAFLVGLLNALASTQGRRMLPDELAEAAIEIEQKRLGENVGCQDQTWAAYGGFNVIRFRQDGTINVTPFAVSQETIEEMQACMLMFFTKITRTSSDIAGKYIHNIPTNTKEQWALAKIAEEGINYIYSRNWESLGQAIGKSWRIKASYANEVSNSEIDQLYETGRIAGAFGGKLTGAGAGGMMLLCGPPEKRERIIKAMTAAGAMHIPFKFEPAGSSIIYCEAKNIQEYR